MTDNLCPPIDILEIALRRRYEAYSRMRDAGFLQAGPDADAAYEIAQLEHSLANKDVYAARRFAVEIEAAREALAAGGGLIRMDEPVKSKEAPLVVTL